jgi:hypothetical protein
VIPTPPQQTAPPHPRPTSMSSGPRLSTGQTIPMAATPSSAAPPPNYPTRQPSWASRSF